MKLLQRFLPPLLFILVFLLALTVPWAQREREPIDDGGGGTSPECSAHCQQRCDGPVGCTPTILYSRCCRSCMRCRLVPRGLCLCLTRHRGGNCATTT